MPLDEDELQDAERAARECGYLDNTFEFHWIEYPPLRAGPHPIIADVEVLDTGSGITRTYQSGNDRAWVVEFDTDLKAGVFGVRSGQRQVRPWRAAQWVQVRVARPRGDAWSVTDENNQSFEVHAHCDADLLDAVHKELRRRYPQDA
jgi:hypothetical protein